MITANLNVIKSDVYDEVAKTTSYEGAKAVDDDKAYERVFTTDADRAMLDRFWDEACNIATDTMKRFITTVSSSVTINNNSSKDQPQKEPVTVDGYHAVLSLSSAYDNNLTPSIEKSLRSFFVNAIISKWDKFANKGNVKSYEDDANAALDDIVKKMFYRKRPQRTPPTQKKPDKNDNNE